jgi:hypothetical protein
MELSTSREAMRYEATQQFPTTAWHVLGLRMEGLPTVMEGSCEYTE